MATTLTRDTIEAIVTLVRAEDWDAAWTLAETTEAALSTQPDPELYGWLYFHRVKIAHARKDWQPAWEALTPRFAAAVSDNNMAWVSSVGAEIAANLGRPDDVVSWGARAMLCRYEQGDARAMLVAARTACELLRSIERDDLNNLFVVALLESARHTGDDEMLAYGYAALMLQVIASPVPERIDVLIAGHAWLSAHAELGTVALVLKFLDEPPRRAELEVSPPKARSGFWARLFGR